MKLTAMQKMVLTVLAFVIAGALVVVFAILPQFSALETLGQQRADAQAKVEQAKAILAQLEDAKTRSAATEAELLKIGTELPDSPQLPSLIIEMQDMANQSGVSMTSFSPAQPVPTPGGQYTELSMNAQVKATWDDLLDYMRRLNRSTRLLRITNVAVTPQPSGESTENPGAAIPLGVTLTIKAYVMGTNGVLSSAQSTSTAQ